MRYFLRRINLLLVLLLMPMFSIAEPIQHAFLVQNSGWMEPFYTDSSSQLKPLVNAVAATVVRPGDLLTVEAFNQQTPGNPSPKILYSGTDSRQINAALAALPLAYKASGALADTDFREAVVATIKGPFQTHSGILWIFTNNRNSPGNDPDTAKRNREFYNLLHIDPSITRSLAFPLKMPVKGAHYRATGLMVYALAYGEAAAIHLQALLADGTLGRVFTIAPAQLKPLDHDAVRIVSPVASGSDNVKVSLAEDKRMRIFDIGSSNKTTQIKLKAGLENLFFPYQIDSAKIVGTLQYDKKMIPIMVSPPSITKLRPGTASEVALEFSIPQEQTPSPWSRAALLAMGKTIVVPATINITLNHQQLHISDDFRQTLSTLFPGDPLSDVFVPPATIQASSTQIPIVLRVQYPLLPVVLTISAILLLIAGLIALAWLAGHTTRYRVKVDGREIFIEIKVFSAKDVFDAQGNVAGRIKRGLGKPLIINTVAGHSLSMIDR